MTSFFDKQQYDEIRLPKTHSFKMLLFSVLIYTDSTVSTAKCFVLFNYCLLLDFSKTLRHVNDERITITNTYS